MSVLDEYKRPWKLFSLCVGTVLLIIGAVRLDDYPDWDIPISLIMALLTYMTAPWSLRVVVERRWQRFPLVLLFTWFSVDGCYWIYWSYQDPDALALMRSANFYASLSLYAICGAVWYFQGSLREYATEIRTFLDDVLREGNILRRDVSETALAQVVTGIAALWSGVAMLGFIAQLLARSLASFLTH